MVAILALAALTADGPAVDARQFIELMRAGTAPLRSVAFVYEGSMRWVGPRELNPGAETFGDRSLGTYYYRTDGAALYDVYLAKPDPTSDVHRMRMSALRGRVQKQGQDYDRKGVGGPEPVLTFENESTMELFDRLDSPHLYFWTWYWSLSGESLIGSYRFEGWEEVEGRNCLKLALVRFGADPKDVRNYRRFWVDVERNAQVVKMEHVTGGQLTARVRTTLASFPLPDGSRYWLPVRGLYQGFGTANRVLAEPAFERTFALVDGSARVNGDLPDAVFSLEWDRNLPLPGDLERLRETVRGNDLFRRFDTQPIPPPARRAP